MHFKSLLHVRDHVKVRGRAFDLLQDIASHTNMHTGEAFELTVERLAHRHEITPEWTRRLLHGVIATGELIVERSRGRHPNRYRFPLERCPACQAGNPELELGVEINPELTQPQPPTETAPTLNSPAANPELEEAPELLLARIEPQKDLKEVKERKERPTLKSIAEEEEKAERLSPFWCEDCGVVIPSCAHRVFEHVRSTPTGAIIREGRPQTREAGRSCP